MYLNTKNKTSAERTVCLSPQPSHYQLVLITHFFAIMSGQDVEGYDKETKDSLLTRNSEYMSVIKENINHPQLKRLVLLYTHPATMKVCKETNINIFVMTSPFKSF